MSVKKFAVVGNPIEHSLSPLIHTMFAKEFDDAIRYDKVLIPIGEFSKYLEELLDQGYIGLNVTIPFKVDAFREASKVSSRARQSGAVNTLKKVGNRLLGENTDGIGFMNDVQNRLRLDVKGKSVLFLGAGGSVRGILPTLLDANPKSVTVVNRSQGRAAQLANEFGIQSLLYDEIGSDVYELIINATPTSLQNKAPLVPSTVFEGCELAYDLVYSALPTAFMQLASDSGARAVSDGLGMLVEQAAESYDFWMGKRPETAAVLASLRASLSS